MKSRRTQFVIVLMLAGLLLIGLLALTGCKKKSGPAAPAGTKEIAPVTIEQTTCPIMGGVINKNFFTEYKGKKVYFCCPGCKEKFEANPQDYVAKLPQFK